LLSLGHMSPRHLFRFVFVFGLAASPVVAFGFGDPAYTPVIFNATDAPIRFIATYSDGRSSPSSLPPGSDAWQRIRGRQLRSLVVFRGAGKRTYSASALDQLRASQGVHDEVWVIGEHGLTLEDRRDINIIRKRVVKTPK
jgi:hypothetical protein